MSRLWGYVSEAWVEVVHSMITTLKTKTQDYLICCVVPWWRNWHRLMVRDRIKLLLGLWPIALVVLNLVILTSVVRKHRLEDKHLLNVMYNLLKRDFLITGLLLVSLLVAPIPLFLFLCLKHLVVPFLVIWVVHKALKLLVHVGKWVAEALVSHHVSAADRTVLLLLANDSLVHLAGCVVVRLHHLWVLDQCIILSFFLGSFLVFFRREYVVVFGWVLVLLW